MRADARRVLRQARTATGASLAPRMPARDMRSTSRHTTPRRLSTARVAAAPPKRHRPSGGRLGSRRSRQPWLRRPRHPGRLEPPSAALLALRYTPTEATRRPVHPVFPRGGPRHRLLAQEGCRSGPLVAGNPVDAPVEDLPFARERPITQRDHRVHARPR